MKNRQKRRSGKKPLLFVCKTKAHSRRNVLK
nr:MAG TPA: hypothetical protein [Caudoviricetes sp.]